MVKVLIITYVPGITSGCAAHGETVEEALDMIRGAIAGYLEAQAEDRRAKNVLA